MSEEFKEKIRSIGTMRRRGQSEHRLVLSENTGKLAGKHIVHWDGRQDAVANPETVRYKLSGRED